MVQQILPPLMVFCLITFIYVTYTVNVVAPQLDQTPVSFPATSGNPKLANPNTNNFQPNVSYTEAVISALTFNILFFMLILSFIRSIQTPPGSIPQLPIWREATFGISHADEEKFCTIINDPTFDILKERDFIINLPVVERKKTSQYRLCTRCEIYKPDRTHHCRVCDRCILRMDHHCPWIMNCVGFMNYKFFLLFFSIYCCMLCAYFGFDVPSSGLRLQTCVGL